MHRTVTHVESYHGKEITSSMVRSSVIHGFFLFKSRLMNGGKIMEEFTPALFATGWAVLPPLIAIVLALITKEVYSSLFI